MTIKGNLLYAQSGGVTSVINVSAAAIVDASAQHPEAIDNVYAAKNGILGVLNEELIDVGRESPEAIRALRHTPSGAFGSCRYKLQDPDRQQREFERIFEVFEQHNIRHFLYNGGGDSADTCLKLALQAKARNLEMTVNHVPKTVDNDLPITDCCPGFGSVAKYIAISTREASFDVAAMALTSTKVFVIEVMGRHAGWIAAAGGLASDAETDIPIIILFPEIPFERQKFMERVKTSVEQSGYVSVVVSEGARYDDGSFLADQGTRDAFGHAQLGGVGPVVANMIREDLGFKFHYAVADYLQRSARHIASKTDFEQAYALGKRAVEYASEGRTTLMPAIRRLADAPYEWDIVPADLNQVANVEKTLPRDYITEDGYGITEKARRYLAPLIEGEDYPPYSNGMPKYVRLKNVLVPRKLPSDWKNGG
ncbi:MAG: 6-phosphofructokinase [Gammaproteobacteria bacterium]|nr:6-phosphofructokinase [Gammaproteobacteria bacterium]